MNFGICNLSVIPVRTEPADKSELATQMLFGETCEILAREKQWLRVHTHADDYTGWVDEKQVKLLDHEAWKETQAFPHFVLNELSATAESATHSLLLLIAASLPKYEQGKFYLGSELFSTPGDATETGTKDLTQRISWNALKFSGAPYLWGGRSLFGMDCSGFTHIVFKLSGIKLRRDAWQQSEQGILVSFIDESRPGDLAFFHDDEGKIIHTGIILGGNKIIHASGKVRLDTLDHFGIYNEEQKRYTHHLRVIKRMMM